jgi:hypothetical protein
MSHTPISRESMRCLKAKRLEEDRIHELNHIIDQIYRKAVNIANNTDDSKYLHMLPMLGKNSYEFHKTNMAEIISRVKSLFPDCSVEHKMLTTVTARDGKKYEISKVDKDNTSDIRGGLTEIGEYIIVDWS